MQNNAKYYRSVIELKKKGGRVASSSHQFDFKQDLLGNAQFYNSTYAKACRGIFNNNHTVRSLIYFLFCITVYYMYKIFQILYCNGSQSKLSLLDWSELLS